VLVELYAFYYGCIIIFCGSKYFGDELCMYKCESNYHICMELNILVWHYNYLILDLCHYLILIFTYEYVYSYALNIVNIHSFFCLIHPSTKHKIDRHNSTYQTRNKVTSLSESRTALRI
jgi:hypothetical protein